MPATCPVPTSPGRSENRGLAWLIGGFIFCPCHLPLTLAFTATVFSGTTVGALLTGYPYIAGALITSVWLAATWRGLHHLRSTARRSTS